MSGIDIDDYIDDVAISSRKVDNGDEREDVNSASGDAGKTGGASVPGTESNGKAVKNGISGKEKGSGKTEQPGNLEKGKSEKPADINTMKSTIIPEEKVIQEENGPGYNLADIRIHWFLVAIAAVLAVFIGLANNLIISDALKRGLYAGAMFWVLAEIIDYVFSRIR